MKFNVYSVFDSVAGAYLPPFYLPTDGMAVRTFSDCANDNNHLFGKHPTDYCLFCLGVFDDSNGSFLLNDAPVSLGLAQNFVRVSGVVSEPTPEAFSLE